MRFMYFTLHNCDNESESTLLINQIGLSPTANYNFFTKQYKNIATIRLSIHFAKGANL